MRHILRRAAARARLLSPPSEPQLAGGAVVAGLLASSLAVVGYVTVDGPVTGAHHWRARTALARAVVEQRPAGGDATARDADALGAVPPDGAVAAGEGEVAAVAEGPPSAVPVPPPADAVAVPPPPPPGPPAEAPPGRRGALPVGKGMWLYEPDKVEGGSVDALVARAVAAGVDNVYVRTGSSRMGFYAAPYLDLLLPRAHAAGIRVYGWDFPYLHDWDDDAARGAMAARHTTPDGHRIDGFVADVETPSEGTNLSAVGAFEYGRMLREAVGPDYPLIVAVPRPSESMMKRYPYAEVIAHFDAVAPMIYWLNRQPDTDVAGALAELSRYGRPLIPIGQAYDGAPEGGRPGPPPPEEIQRFLVAAEQAGAVGTSFWSWQHATQPIWDTIANADQFRLPDGAAHPDQLLASQVRSVQGLLVGLGHPVATTGVWDGATTDALRDYQVERGLAPTGYVDPVTASVIARPIAPKLRHTG